MVVPRAPVVMLSYHDQVWRSGSTSASLAMATMATMLACPSLDPFACADNDRIIVVGSDGIDFSSETLLAVLDR